MSREDKIVLGILLALGIALHLYRLGYPSEPVFDEHHFATYAADYLTGRDFIDIHPPLGKFIYAGVLAAFPRSTYANAQFLDFKKTPDGGLTPVTNGAAYGDFPYVPLRAVSAFFGVAIPIIFYFLMLRLGAGRVAASLAGFFLIFENSLLLITRLILLDGMFIAFGLAALTVYFWKGNHRTSGALAVIAGALWGLSLGVKLTAIVFAGPVILAYLLERNARAFRTTSRFVAAAGIVFLAVALFGAGYFPTPARLTTLSFYNFLGGNAPQLTAAWQAAHPVRAYLLADIGEMMFSYANYIAGPPQSGQSPWYFWPFMQAPLSYYHPSGLDGPGALALTGNPVVWFPATLAVIAGLAVAWRYFKERARNYAFFILLGGYLSVLLPFVLFVRRSTFLYHYLPALPFAYGLLAWFIARGLHAQEFADLTRKKWLLFSGIILFAAIGFLSAANSTFGL